MKAIEGENISHSYTYTGSSNFSLDDINIEIFPGEFIAILGHNGCGKSTLVKHFNALIPLQNGELSVAAMDVKDPSMKWDIRRKCGMVFQNPDNQFVSSIVYEDIAFGLENYDFPKDKIPEKIEETLELVGMPGAGKRSTHMLSGGQKQRVALAGVLALDADIIVLDEAAIMLDPAGRQEIMDIIRQLNKEKAKNIILISHYMEDAVFADRVYVMANGKILTSGSPQTILSDRPLLKSAGLMPPMPVQVYYDLLDAGIKLERCPLTEEELAEELCRLY